MAFFRLTSFFAPRALLMDFAKFCEIWASNPKSYGIIDLFKESEMVVYLSKLKRLSSMAKKK